jgi:hypothetical protein
MITSFRMTAPLATTSACRLPPDALAGLAPFRARDDVRALLTPEALWVFFSPGDAETARALLALPHAQLFSHHEHWRPLGQQMPTFDVPSQEEAREISRLIFPEPVVPREATPSLPVEARLVRGGPPHDATALRLPLARLAQWATLATRHDLAGFQCAINGAEALAIGPRLPPLEGERYWGDGLFIPVGWRPEPALPLPALREAFGLGGDIGLWTPEGLEAIPAQALGGVSLARLRLGVAQ